MCLYYDYPGLCSSLDHFTLVGCRVSALDTLANQAGKSASPKLASLYAMRTFIVCAMFMPFIFLIMWNAEPFFRLVLHSNGEESTEIFHLASSYLKIMSLAMPAVSAYECLRRYLQSCGKMIGPALAFALASAISIFLNWLLVHGPEPYRLGFLGAPLATVIAYNSVSPDSILIGQRMETLTSKLIFCSALGLYGDLCSLRST